MAFKSPTLAELKDRIVADIERHTGEPASQRGDIYYGLAMAQVGASYAMHKHLDYNSDQLFDDTADNESIVRRASEMGIDRIAATRASGAATVDADDGRVIEAETVYIKDDLSYRVTEDATASGGSATIQLKAVDPGVDHNLNEGETLTITSTIAGADTQATVTSDGITGGADIESIDRLRARLEERRKNPPQGGSADDYVRWAKEAHVDVTRAWAYENENGLGTVVVRFTTDDLASPIPSQAHKDAVEDYINQDGVRPAGMAGFDVGDLYAKDLNITFTKLEPNTESVREAIEAELDDFLSRESEPGGTILLSQVREAISSASGERDHEIDLNDDVDSNPTELILLGTLTWPAE